VDNLRGGNFEIGLGSLEAKTHLQLDLWVTRTMKDNKISSMDEYAQKSPSDFVLLKAFGKKFFLI
jgi:hypothetical protein